MKKSVVLGVLSKSSRFGRQKMVNLCNVRTMVVNNDVRASCNMWQTRMRLNNPFTVVEQLKCFYSSELQRRDDESDSDAEYSSKDLDFEADVDDASQEHRRFLYPDSQDPVILKLNDCASVQAVFDVASQYESEFSVKHASQAILVLWDLQKMYCRIIRDTQSRSDILTNSTKDLLADYTEKVISHNAFKKIVHCIDCAMTELSPDAVTCSFLYLKRMGIPFHRPVMQNLLLHIEELLKGEGSSFPLSALSRYTVSLREGKDLYFVSAVQNAIPLMYEKIGSCWNEVDLNLLSICFHNVGPMLSSNMFNAYTGQIEELITSGLLPTFDTSVIVKTASVLSSPLWTREHYGTNRKVLLLLKGKTSTLNTSDVIRVHKMIEKHLEPADLQTELSECASHLLSEEESLAFFESDSVDLLQCIVSFSPPKKRKALENLTLNYIKQNLNPQIIASLFKILRYLKTSNTELCDEFWSKTLDVMRVYPGEYSDGHISKYCNRYMFFNNNLSGTYRHYAFENQLIEWYLHHYEKGVIEHFPSKFARMIGFFMAYCDAQASDFFDKFERMVTKLDEMSSQLSLQDCIQVSRGIQISSQLHYKAYPKPHMYAIYIRLNSILNTCLRRQIDVLDNNIVNTNMLMRSYVMRKEPQSTDIIQNIVTRYQDSCGSINSRILRDAAHNFLLSKCLVPEAVEQLTEFVVQNGAHVFGDTVEILLFLCLNLGYVPSNVEVFSKVASEVILRESHRMTGLSVLHSGLALCFFHSLPEELVHIIFTINFLQRLEEEIENCFAKTTYPSRIRNYLMQLNRAVCLDYPQYDIPWFHKKYCEELAVTDPVQTSVFYTEVRDTLINVLGGKAFVSADSYSPYGHKLEFEIFLNENGVPLSSKHRSDKGVFRKAIVLLTDDAFSNNVKSLNGYSQMKKRHLEMLGYEVIEVTQSMWNSMYMTEPGLKHNFIRERVFRKDTSSTPMH